MQLSPQRAERLSLAALVLHLLSFLLIFFIAKRANSMGLLVESWHFLGGCLIWLVLLLQFRQRRLAQEEQFDAQQYEQLRREGKDTSVFEGSAVEQSFQLAGRRLVWLEKYLLPTFGFLAAGYLLGMGYWLYRLLTIVPPRVPAGESILLESAAFMAVIALVSFLFSRYASGMSQQVEWRPLRAGGSYLLSNALASFLMVGALLAGKFEYFKAEEFMAYVLTGLMFVIGVEVVLNLVLDAYRPRIKGMYRRAAFESRILGLFSEPGGLLRTAAHAIDYQFGFKVSETWFYRLLERAFVPLILVQGAALYLLTCVAIVPPGSVGVLERFGAPVNVEQPYASGLHLKLPWPMDKVRLFPVEQVQVIDVGFKRNDPVYFPDGREALDLTPILWTKEHWKEEYPLMVAVPASGARSQDSIIPAGGPETMDQNISRNIYDMLVYALTVHYRIVDVGQYAYGRDKCYSDPRGLLEAICNREVVHFCARSNIDELMGPGRHQATQSLKNLVQEKADEQQLGVKIIFAGLASVHPAINVAEAFEKVVSALQEKQAEVLKSQGEAHAIMATAEGESSVLLNKAQAYKAQRSLVTQAAAQRFDQQMLAYEKGKDVYLWREYLSVLDEMLPPVRKYFISSNNVNSWIYELDLKEKLQPDLFEGLDLSKKPEQESSK